MEVLHTLETAWMKGILARRRWHRWYHAIIAMNRYIIFMRVLETSCTVLCEFASGWWIRNCKNRWYHAIIAMNRYIIFKRVLDTFL